MLAIAIGAMSAASQRITFRKILNGINIRLLPKQNSAARESPIATNSNYVEYGVIVGLRVRRGVGWEDGNTLLFRLGHYHRAPKRCREKALALPLPALFLFTPNF